MAGIAPVTEIGGVYNGNDRIPIYSIESVDLKRSQSWDVSGLGVYSAVNMIWGGSDPVEYSVDFNLIIGWGADLQTADDLMKMARLWHAWGSHRQLSAAVDTGSGPMASQCAPVPVEVLIAGQISAIGYLKNVATKMSPPWRKASNYYDLVGTSCQFTGTFMVVPGLTSTKDISIAMMSNNTGLSYSKVKDKFYNVSA